MQTIPEYACYIEQEDFILHDDKTYQVSDIDDTGDVIVITVRDEEGEYNSIPIGPFEQLKRITSLED